ncbi:MAG: universal stress protein [Alphaproteobacteria bacterium]
MRTVLCAVGDGESARSALATAYLIASRGDGYIEGFYPGMGSPMIITGGFGGGMGGGGVVPTELVAGLEREELQRRDRARAAFTQFMNEHGVPMGPVDPAAKGVTASWFDNAAMQASEVVGNYGRVFDVVCVSRPRRDDAALSLAFVEAALFESGRPVLLAPPDPPKSIGTTVVIAWNASTETARTLALGMPLVGNVQRAVVLTVKDGSVNGPPGEDAARNLRCHGITTEAVEVESGGQTVGEAILAYCKEIGADLLVKGAYTQSRLRQMIFGGATQHILTSAELPVIMAH